MQMEDDEQRLLFMSVGVVVLSIIALALFILQSWALFFIIAIVGLLFGVYLAYGISKSGAHPPAQERRKRR